MPRMCPCGCLALAMVSFELCCPGGRAVELAPNHSVAWSRLGSALVLARDVRAATALARAAELRPDDVGPRHDLAVLASVSGDFDEAARWHQHACAIDPDDPQLSALGRQLERHGIEVACR